MRPHPIADLEAGPVPRTVFVVSNAGQLRNAVAIVAQLGISHPVIAVLWTEVRSSLRDRLLEFAADAEIEAIPIELPRSPTDPFPRQLRAIHRAYVGLLDRTGPCEVWVANTNSHYAHLLGLAEAKGVSLAYFEEGLGTYRRADDPPFREENRRNRFGKLFADVIAAFSERERTLTARIRRAGHRVLRASASDPVGQRVVAALVGQAAANAFRPWRHFDRVVVAFPEALDPHLYCAPQVTALNLTIENFENAEAWLAQWSAYQDACALLVTQPYGIEDQSWSTALAKALLRGEIKRVIVKFHPREGLETRRAIIDALANADIDAIVDSQLDRFSAEQLIRAGICNRVIGLTSSVLLYRPRGRGPAVEYESIAAEVVNNLAASGANERQLCLLRSDLELFDRVTKTLEAGIDT